MRVRLLHYVHLYSYRGWKTKIKKYAYATVLHKPFSTATEIVQRTSIAVFKEKKTRIFL